MEKLNLSQHNLRLRFFTVVAGMVIAVICSFVFFTSSESNEPSMPQGGIHSRTQLGLGWKAFSVTTYLFQPSQLN
ncbi:MAG TPA: hypothetical protein VGD40_17770 [Chryseosolibacter sp.]